jgi:hypothetical protein
MDRRGGSDVIGARLRRRSSRYRTVGGGGSEDYPFDGTGTLTSPWIYWGNIDSPAGGTLNGAGQLELTGISNGTGNSGGVAIPTPAPDYEYEASGSMVDRDWNNHFGLVVRESATSKFLHVGVGKDFSGAGGSLDGIIRVHSSTNGRLVRTIIIPSPGVDTSGAVTYNAKFRIARVGSSLVLKCNYNGLGWATIATRNLTDDFTTAPDQIGLFVDPRVPAGNPNNTARFEYLDQVSGGGTTPGSHLWRVNVSASQAGGNIAIGELEFRASAGGASQSTGGTPIYSVQQSGLEAAKAYDGNAATAWAAANTIPSWLGYSHLAPFDCAEVMLRAWGDATFWNLAPKDFTIQKSTDYGMTWTTMRTVTGEVWSSAGQIKTFSVP